MGFDFLGPFFPWETARLARRKRNYLFRSLYVTVLLLLMLVAYWPVVIQNIFLAKGMTAVGSYAWFADTYFYFYSLATLTAVLLLTPTAIAPIMAAEKQKGNLPVLLTTDLTGWEMVAGRAAAKMATIAYLVLAGLPVISISSICGGIELGQLALLGLLTLATLLIAAGISIISTVYSSTARRALMRAYVVLGILLLLPVCCSSILLKLPPKSAAYSAVHRFYATILEYHPYTIFGDAVLVGWHPDAIGQIINYCILASTMFVACLLWTSFRARSVCRRTVIRVVHRPRYNLAQRFRRLWVRKIGSNPMLWKDWYFERRASSSFTFGTSFGVCALFVAYLTLQMVPSLDWTVAGLWDSRILNEYLSYLIPAEVILALLAVGVRSCSSFDDERKQNCLELLQLSDLSPGAIVAAKWLASLKPLLFLAVAAAPALIIAVIADGISIASLCLLGPVIAIYGIFFAGVGTYCSLKWKSPVGAATVTMGTLFAVMVGVHYAVLVWFIPPLMIAMQTLDVPLSFTRDIFPLGYPWYLLSELTFRANSIQWNREIFCQSAFALLPLLGMCWCIHRLSKRMLEHFSEYSGQSDHGERRSITKEEVIALAAAQVRNLQVESATGSGELLTHTQRSY